MDEIIRVQDQFYILATSSRIDENGRTLKHGDTFAIFDPFGNILRLGLGEQGLYHDGTRYLSRFEFLIFGRRPLLLSSAVREDNACLTIDLTNPDISDGETITLPRDSVHVRQTCFLWAGACHRRVRFHNYLRQPVVINVTLLFEADFADIFEVRGTRRARRGETLPALIEKDRVTLRYRGLDGPVRESKIEFTPAPTSLDGARAQFQIALDALGTSTFYVAIRCSAGGEADGFDAARSACVGEQAACRAADAQLASSNEQFNDWVRRSAADLNLMCTRTRHGPYPYAGVPWFSTPFGRDGIITALQYLWVNPQYARGVLGFLAEHQARAFDAGRDAEPGKILHEMRGGEMAALGEVPFGRYYGSVDSTPLFLMLAAAYHERTADTEFVREIWPNIEAALAWINDFGDVDGDGFVEYARKTPTGLAVQGWKDSFDSVFHADGTLAVGPVALCEVQGYVYAARRGVARLARQLGLNEVAERETQKAEVLRAHFEAAYWCEEISTYALALDGEKRPCRVRTSNPGHCLFTGIVSPDRARKVAQTLLSEGSYSGWGIRTVAVGEARYNPMSYHNGSIWPHDNAIAAAGMARYGLMREAQRVFAGLFDSSVFMPMHRLPELFCGFDRRIGEGPTLYPVACSPQSWAAGAVFMLVQALLGLTIDAAARRIQFKCASLPEPISHMVIRNLSVGDAKVDLSLKRFPMNVGMEILHRDGQVEIANVK